MGIDNRGKTWTPQMVGELRELYHEDKSNEEIAHLMGRSEWAIYCKLEALGLDPTDKNSKNLKIEDTIDKETLMKNRTVTTKTFVGDIDAATLDVEQLLDLMEQEQGFIERIGKLRQTGATTKLTQKHLDNYKALEKLLAGLV